MVLAIIKPFLLVGERAKRARHSQVCSNENRDIMFMYVCHICPLTLSDSYNPIKKVERKFEIATRARVLCMREL